MEVSEYLLSLNPIAGSDKIWLPKIGENELVELRKSDNPVYIAHDWFSQGSYEYGIYTIIDGKIRNLRHHPNARIVNSDGNFIFESTSLISSYKGLVAIEVFKDIKSPIFVMERNFDAEEMKTSVSLWFKSNTPKSSKDEIIKLVKDIESSCSISSTKEAWISVYAEDYDRMLQQLVIQLI